MLSAPDFIMLGVREGNGRCSIYASTELDNIQLRSEMQVECTDVFSLCRVAPKPVVRHFINAELRSFVVATGDTYELALGALLNEWTPPDTRPEKPQKRRAITPRRAELER